MLKHKPKIGDKFNKLTYIGEAPDNKYGNRRALFECECGKQKICDLSHVILGNTRSCGCIRSELARRNFIEAAKRNSDKTAKTCINWLYRDRYKKGSLRRGLEFKLSETEFITLINNPCYYCGRLKANKISSAAYTLYYNGIDRLDNSIGYTLQNCVACCRQCNFMKGTLSSSSFIEQCLEISKLHNK